MSPDYSKGVAQYYDLPTISFRNVELYHTLENTEVEIALYAPHHREDVDLRHVCRLLLVGFILNCSPVQGNWAQDDGRLTHRLYAASSMCTSQASPRSFVSYVPTSGNSHPWNRRTWRDPEGKSTIDFCSFLTFSYCD